MGLFTLSSVTFLLAACLLSEGAWAQKYHSANDADVEFSLEEKNKGPQPFYIDKEAIEKARQAQYASEKKEAIWLAKRISKFLDHYRSQKIAIQNRALAERNYITQQSMNDLSDDAKKIFSAQAEQARALIARSQQEQLMLAQAAQSAQKQGTEVSRALASLDRPVFSVFKHQPKRPHALKLWSKLNKKLAYKAQQAALKQRAAAMGIVASAPSSLPLGVQATKTIKADRQPASSITSPKRTDSLWQGVANKLTEAYSKLKSKLFNW
ncbi:MAG: hypothetical protein HYV97_08500 [Bdellovibrio sp.]|nr:hypothetical protein [Bdellovibrio sp.]